MSFSPTPFPHLSFARNSGYLLSRVFWGGMIGKPLGDEANYLVRMGARHCILQRSPHPLTFTVSMQFMNPSRRFPRAQIILFSADFLGIGEK
jgi:hypothetical protein